MSIKVKDGRESSVGIATGYGLGGPRIDSWRGEIYSRRPDLSRGPHSLLNIEYQFLRVQELILICNSCLITNKNQNSTLWTSWFISQEILTVAESVPSSLTKMQKNGKKKTSAECAAKGTTKTSNSISFLYNITLIVYEAKPGIEMINEGKTVRFPTPPRAPPHF